MPSEPTNRRLALLSLILSGLLCHQASGQTVDQPALNKAYNTAVDAQNAAIDSVVAIDGASNAPEFTRLVDAAKAAIRSAATDLAAARFNTVAAATTAAAYATALKDGRLADAATAASLWTKQAALVRSQLADWGTDLAAAREAITQAKKLLTP